VAIQVSQPQAGATLNGRQGITLNARVEGDPQLRLLAGIDFTLRDGRVEEACPVDFRGEGSSQQLERSTDFERSLNQCPPDLTNDANKAVVATQNYRQRPICVAGKTILFTRRVMIKTLERHHPAFYNRARPTVTTTFFPGNPSVEDIFEIAQQVLNQNTSIIRDLPPSGRWDPLYGVVNGIEYEVGVTNLGLVTVYPSEQPGICAI